MDECQLEHVFKKNSNLLLARTPSKNMSMAKMNMEDEKHIKK
jgi:hypothetical protein